MCFPIATYYKFYNYSDKMDNMKPYQLEKIHDTNIEAIKNRQEYYGIEGLEIEPEYFFEQVYAKIVRML